ncbi:sensor histidine kinase [Paenibacillus pini]|uniref:Two-component sensor histidine kinase n=1 Tax=Paenibacillus pini JCM 16418 TaxID=1236976 RepID=W7YGE6_9BACL|nr:sensor histidine kinase [Paenibacillus pini]GAF07557.1 two-component sensor histidine kinase [Paenibacillus pini JCM 16418]
MGRGFRSIRSRLFLLFLCCMCSMVILVSLLYYNLTLSIIHTKIKDIAEKNISQTAGLFNLLLEGYNSVTKSLNSNFELARLLQESISNPAVAVMNERMITNIIGAAYYSRNEIEGIHIITNSGKVYSYEKRFAGVIDINYTHTEWYRKLQASSGNMVWLGLYSKSPLNTMQEDTVFVFGRRLYDLTDHKPIGILIIETDPAPIMGALSNASISPNSRVYITGNMNKVIATTDMQKDKGPDFSLLLKPTTEEPIIVEYYTDQLVVAAKTAMADWTIYGLTPMQDISAEIVQTRQYLVIVVLFVVILSTILASIISRNIASPLKLLIREMKKMERGNFNGSVNVKSFEEINMLVSSFNRMVHRMDELIERIKLSSVSEKNAQLHALQSQVNPHFLYNTLDMIYWMLDEKGNERLSHVVLSLSQMFRYSSNWEEASLTTLRQELEQIRHYLTIIENRLLDRVHTNIQVEEHFLDVILPKMTIQPIIENAVKYGLEPLDRPGTLHVYTQFEKGKLYIRIEDNGEGMDDNKLELVNRSLRDFTSMNIGSKEQSLRRSIGLQNVDSRIMLMFGEDYGITVESKQGIGTTVTVAIPAPIAISVKGDE